MNDKKRIARHDAAGHFGEPTFVVLHNKAGKDGTRPLYTATHLNDHPACRTGMPRPQRKDQRFTGTMRFKEGDQLRRAVSSTDEADLGAWLCRPDRRFYPILKARILPHMS